MTDEDAKRIERAAELRIEMAAVNVELTEWDRYPMSQDEALASIAISLKRIADAMADGFTIEETRP